MEEYLIQVIVNEEKNLYADYDPAALLSKPHRLLGIGVLFIVLGILIAGQVNSVMAAIISTIGSFSVWEASAVWIETLPSLRKKERLLRRLAEAEIRYTRSE